MGIEESIGDAVSKGKEFLEQNKDRVEGALKSEQAEEISDKVLGSVSDFVKKVAPAASEHVDSVRDSVDKAIGTE